MIILFIFTLVFSILFLILHEKENSATLYESYEETLETYLKYNFTTFGILETVTIKDSKVIFIYGNEEFFTAIEIEKYRNGYRINEIIASYDLISNPFNLVEVDIPIKGKTIHFEVGKLNDTSLDYDPFENMLNMNTYLDNIVYSYHIIE